MWEDISIAHAIIIIKSEVSTLPIIIFSVVVCLKCLVHHMLSLIAYTFRKKPDFVFIIIAQLMMSANSSIHFGLQIVFVCLYITPSHYHNCANLSEDIKMPVRYIVSSVWVRLSIFSQLSILHAMGLCVFNLPIPLMMTEKGIHFLLLSSSN